MKKYLQDTTKKQIKHLKRFDKFKREMERGLDSKLLIEVKSLQYAVNELRFLQAKLQQQLSGDYSLPSKKWSNTNKLN